MILILLFFFIGGLDFEKGFSYIWDLFFKKKFENKNVYLYVICVMDIDLMKDILNDVFEILVNINLKRFFMF